MEDCSDDNKPLTLANKPFPYNQIADPRRSEQLVYSLYSAQTRNNNFKEFDNISLMSSQPYGKSQIIQSPPDEALIIACGIGHREDFNFVIVELGQKSYSYGLKPS